jgi:putative Holliday junction resolvase
VGRILSIDYGLARIGLAISDERRIIATSLGMLLAEKTPEKSIEKILAHLSNYQIDTIIIGMPYHMSGKQGTFADVVESFANLLKTKVFCPVVLWDERLSTVQAEKSLREGNMNRKNRSKVIDAVAAIILLQNYLESLSIAALRDS